jgi:hypothetical protein
MGFINRYVRRASATPLGFDDWTRMLLYQGREYPFFGRQTLTGTQEQILHNYVGYAQASKSNAIVFSLMALRMRLFSDARFQFCELAGGRPGKMFGDQSLEIVERPWTNGTTGDLLSRMIQDADLAGNNYEARRRNRLYRLRPDWVTIVLGSPSDPEGDGWAYDAEVLGYGYQEGGPHSGKQIEIFLPHEVSHFAPIPDPMARFRGMSWIEPVVRELMGDNAATEHKLKFFENGGTPNMVVSTDLDLTEDQYNDWVDAMENASEGLPNAYRTLYLAKGGKADVVGANLRQIDFKSTQGAGETRMAAAAGIHPVIAGFSEGLQGSSLNAGNVAAARRNTADGTFRPTWKSAAGSLQVIVPPPHAGSELCIDTRDTAWLREDQMDAADIAKVESETIHNYIIAGYTPDSVISFMETGDRSVLEHSGMYSVQLQPAGTISEGKGSTVTGTPEPTDPAPPAPPAK